MIVVGRRYVWSSKSKLQFEIKYLTFYYFCNMQLDVQSVGQCPGLLDAPLLLNTQLLVQEIPMRSCNKPLICSQLSKDACT
jgi:hypothetical protein